ncbi:MAG: PAS domain S-box protein [Rhodoferax sp.]|nr:PAS domain S-box protein [Rhodoferax sp.]
MNKKPAQKPPLRMAAEAQLMCAPPLPAHSVEELLHELQAHQIELETQNDELRRAHLALQESRNRYVDLYEFAPVGYLTVTGEGRIAEINMTCATLLGEDRQKLLNRHFAGHVMPKDGDRWHQFLRSALGRHDRLSCELAMKRDDGSRFHARLDCLRPEFEATVVRITVTDITESKHAEAQLRIAAIAFECQEGIVVMDANSKILRVNQAFKLMTGYSQRDLEGQTTALLRSDLHPPSFYEGVLNETRRTGAWQGDMWQRRKNGEDYPARVTCTAVMDGKGEVTHHVGNFTDTTSSQLQEQQRLLNETTQRNLLVREVHHRIKNNLQGISGLLRQFAQKHPETAEPINQAISHLQGISVIHGMQGRAITSSVRLCELTGAIADEVQNLWQTTVIVDIPPAWIPRVIAEKESVPIALIVNELIVNAVKHGGKAHGHVSITLRKGSKPDVVQINIINAGQLPIEAGQANAPYSGLQLIAALMPRHGARIVKQQHGDLVITSLELEPPVISLDLK